MAGNVIPFSLGENANIKLDALNSALASNAYLPCSSLQVQSSGWLPHGANESYARNVGGHTLMRFMIEKRAVPGGALKAAIKEETARFIQRNGNKPSKDEKLQIKDAALAKLLPRAFPKFTDVAVWMDAGNQYLMVGTSSTAVADLVFSSLIACDGLFGSLTRLMTPVNPADAMLRWLSDAPPEGYTVDDACELVLPADGATVKYVHHNLDGEDVRQHLREGKVPVSLALTHDDQLSFQLTDKLLLKSIKLLESSAPADNDSADPDDKFAVEDASFMLFASAVGGTVYGLVQEMAA